MDGRYVVGVDGSSPSHAAAGWAADRAARDGASVVLAHVRDPEAGMMGEDFAREESLRSSALLEGLTDDLRELGIDVSSVVVEGLVANALADFVADDDVVVIGTHKTGFLHGRVLGSRSVQIASNVSCSVAVIPDVDLRFRRAVVLGVDRVETAGMLARAAAAEAVSRGEELVIVHAEQAGARPDAESPLAIAVSAVREAHPSLTVRARVSGRPPAEALLDAARDKNLLVLGPGSTAPNRSPIGSVLHDVLLNVNAPVLIVRPAFDREPVPPALMAP